MTTLNVQNTEPQGGLSWAGVKKYFFLVAILVPLFQVFSAYQTVTTEAAGLWLWLLVLLNVVIVPIADIIFGHDTYNPTQEQEDALKSDGFYVWVMYLAIVAHWLALITTAYAVSVVDLPWYHFLGAIIGIGAMHSVSFAISHELGHRVNKKTQTWVAKFATAIMGYAHFNIEHNKGHHKHVATPEDAASSRMGENVYKFALRELPGGFVRAWALERARLSRLGKPTWSFSNEIIHSWLMTLIGFGAMIFILGVQVIPFLIFTSFYGWFQLTMANYIEHYGLLRQKLDNGKYQRCEPKHSWNSNFRLSNLISLHLQRHSDHHANPTRPYQMLRDYPEAPQMPTGYPTMMMMTLIPPLWYWVMDRKVVAWAEGDMNLVNMDAEAKDKLFARYHKKPTDQNSETAEVTP